MGPARARCEYARTSVCKNTLEEQYAFMKRMRELALQLKTYDRKQHEPSNAET